MDSFDEKIMNFAIALQDLYKDEENRESNMLSKMELKEETITEDFTAMVYAMWTVYRMITNDDMDIISFTYICNKLVIQKLLEDKNTRVE